MKPSATSATDWFKAMRPVDFSRIDFWLLGLLAAVTLVFNSQLAAPFDLPKTLLLWNGTLFLLVLFLKQQRQSQDVPRFRYHPLIGFYFVMVAGFLPSLTQSLDLYASLFGAYPFYFGGLISWVSFGLLFFLVLQKADHLFAKRLITVATGVTAVVCLYALTQALDLDPIKWSSSPREPFSTLGGALFLSGYLAMTLPLVVSFVLLEQRRAFTFAGYLLLGLMVHLILVTLARSAWLGALIALCLLIALLGPSQWSKYSKKLAILGCLLGTLLTWHLFLAPLIKKQPSGVQNRAQVFLSPNENSSRARLEMWLIGLTMFLDHPLLGIGLDNVEQKFWAYRSEEHMRLAPLAATTSPMHNDFLQILVTTGITGFAGYIFFLAVGILTLWRVLKKSRDQDRLRVAGLISGLMALGVFGQFNFSLLATSAWAIFLLGSLAALDQKISSQTARGMPKLAPIVTVAGFFFLAQSARMYLADQAFAEGNFQAHKKNFDKSAAQLSLAIKLNPRIRQYRYSYSTLLFAKGRAVKTPAKDRPLYLEKAVETIEETARQFPWHSLTWHNLAKVLAYRAFEINQPRLAESVKQALRRSMALFPAFPANYEYYGETLYRQGRRFGPKALFVRALEITPHEISARNWLEVYKPASYVYFFNQDLRIAQASLGKTVPRCQLDLVNDRQQEAEIVLEVIQKPKTMFQDLGDYWDLAQLGWVKLKEEKFILAPDSVKNVELEIAVPDWPWWRGKKFVAIVHAKDKRVNYPFGAYGRIFIETQK
ncbi:MAG: O-antigen ligase family protein [Elusimicrobia bacterium]|nr:O-antigen ligase family protein [Elusimicrobiota bacterium]